MFKKKLFLVIFAVLIIWVIEKYTDSVEQEENLKLQPITDRTWISVNEFGDREFKVIIKFDNRNFSIIIWDYEKDINVCGGVFSAKKDKLVFRRGYFNKNLLDKIFNYEFDWDEQSVNIDYYCNDEEFVIFGKYFKAIVFKNIDTEIIDYYETKHFKIYCQNEDYNTIRDIVNTLYKAISEAEKFFSIDCRERTVNVFIYKDENDLQRKYSAKYGIANNILGFANKDEIYSINESIILTHEYIHTVTISGNYDHRYALINEGIAVFLSYDKTDYLSRYDFQTMLNFDRNDMYTLFHARSTSSFYEQNKGVYKGDFEAYAGKFIEYIQFFYGRDKVLELLKNNSYEKVLDKDIETIFDEWKYYLKNKYNY
jgi:hypothetical protein